MRLYISLFFGFLKIGLFSIGGGYAALPLIQEQVVEQQHWLTLNQFTDLITISQMTPGPIAINGATFVGMQVAGLPGALSATAGCVFPSFVIVLCLAALYQKYGKLEIIRGLLSGLRPVVTALIASAGITILQMAFWKDQNGLLGIGQIEWKNVILFVIALVVLRKKKPNPVWVMAACGAAGIFLYT